MKKILVSGAGGDIGQGILQCLERSSLPLEVYKIGSSPLDAGLHFDDKSFVSPLITAPNYIDFLLNFFSRHSIDLYIPGIDAEILVLAQNLDKLNRRSSTHILVDSIDQVKVAHDKFSTTEFFTLHQLPAPRSAALETRRDFTHFLTQVRSPFILKSRVGCGSNGVKLIHDPADINPLIGNKLYMVQEYLEGEEYTAGLYKGNDNEIKGCAVFKRELKNGATKTAERVVDNAIEVQLKKITLLLGLRYTNIQFKIQDNKVLPFEINSRFSGTTGIISSLFNAPEMAIRELLFKENITPVTNADKFYAMRYSTEILCSELDIQSLRSRSGL